MPGTLSDEQVRLAVFAWLADQVRLHGDVLPRTLLAEGIQLDGQRVPLVGPQGIFKPRVLSEIPLSIATITSGPYNDAVGPDGLLRYRYRGTDPNHPDNAGLRAAMRSGLPLVYFHSVVPGRYLAAWPVYIVGDDVPGLSFTVAVDDIAYASYGAAQETRAQGVAESLTEGRRAYITAVVLQRLHQRGFRERVLRAYQDQCALCRLRHRALLDAAHIIGDREPEGDPLVRNGLALCKLHHSAFDTHFLGIRPDYVIVVRQDVLEERDGPMLLHGLQRLHEQPILLPRAVVDRPAVGLLEVKYERFLAATRAA